MADNTRLKIVLCWHMHQPEYRDHRTDNVMQPWTYLRAIKDYTDMAAHLEMVDGARAVVNFTPILLEQLLFYIQQIENHLKYDRLLQDPLLAALARTNEDIHQNLSALLQLCVTSQNRLYAQRYETYNALMKFAEHLLNNEKHVNYIHPGFMDDLLVWFHLGWFGETVQLHDPRLQRMINKAEHFSYEDRKQLLEIIGEQVAAVIPRYRRLAETGKIELAMSPYAHPIAPLLLDFASANEALPACTLPQNAGYPGGKQQLIQQINCGIEIFTQCFGQKPIGCWPAEGAISEETLKQLDEAGFLWAASGTGVLYNSLEACGQPSKTENAVHNSYQYNGLNMSCFFRDDGLSDLIGFSYATWHADDAVANLVHHLEQIYQHSSDRKNAIVSIIMDGENAWEHYPHNGYYFLQALYKRLSSHPQFLMTTFSECLSINKKPLPKLVAGSWVYGNLNTWIGSPDKNRAWDMLVEAKQHFDQAMRSDDLSYRQKQEAQKQMAICEGSDWFWWPGEDNPDLSISSFDTLYRTHLTTLYHLIKVSPPGYLAQPYTHQKSRGDAALGGLMRKNT